MTLQHVEVRHRTKHHAAITVDGVRVGTASDCDHCWVVVITSKHDKTLGKLSGSYPARNAEELAYAINECVDGVLATFIPKH